MWPVLEHKRVGVFDTECDGLLHTMTRMLCGVVIDAHTKTATVTNDLAAFVQELDTYDVLVGHNIIGFDLPMLKQKYGWSPRPEVIILDTLWMSRMYHPDIDGGHSLSSWGKRIGQSKQEYYPVWDPDQPHYNLEADATKEPGWEGAILTSRMQEYCKVDVEVTRLVFHKLCDLLRNFTWQSINCEMLVAILIQRQMEHGFVFNLEAAEVFHAQLVERRIELEDEVHRTFMPLPEFIREIQPKVKKDHTLSSVGVKSYGDDWEAVIPVPEFIEKFGEDIKYTSGSFSLIKWPEFSLGSRQQIAERLTRAGYKLTKQTEKGNFIIDDVVLQEAADAGIPEAKPLAEYFLIQKLEAMVKNWITAAVFHKDQGVYRIHGYVNSMGANTNRMTHSNPNVAQVPAAGSPYGKQCRSLFGVRKGYKLVGCDASGLELRTLAHYIGDPEYIKTLLTGDIHTANQLAAGLPTRNNAKTFIYAFLYGAGDAKIGSIVGGGAKDGKRLKESFLEKTPALKKLREGVIKAAQDRGWLRGFDGRILRVRSPHSALNTLLQGMGAIVMKYWLIEVARVADAEGLDWNPSANIHDEGQFEVLEAHVERFKEICIKAFITISEQLGSKCLLEGEAKHGDTWFDTH